MNDAADYTRSFAARPQPLTLEQAARITPPVRAGDLVVFDCGMIGPFSYGADVSRAFHCGPGQPGEEQRKLYTLAWNEVMHNTQLPRRLVFPRPHRRPLCPGIRLRRPALSLSGARRRHGRRMAGDSPFSRA